MQISLEHTRTLFKDLLAKHKLLLFLILLFLIAEVIVDPIANFPLNDDWAYGKSVKKFLEEGVIDVGDFAAMTLFSQILWGSLFTKIFGFSFTVLRFSTLLSALIGVVFLNKLVVEFTKNNAAGFIACFTLLFNPIYFCLSNSFMTDVNFNTLLILACYCSYNFFKTSESLSFVMVFILSALLVLMRQYGIIIPLCFSFACLFSKNKRWLYLVLSVIMTIGVMLLFKYYEHYLRGILPSGAAYQYSDKTHVTSKVFWDKFALSFGYRNDIMLHHILLYTFPLTLVYLVSLLKKFKWYLSLPVLVLSSSATCFFRETPFPLGNTFINSSLGAETFLQIFVPTFHTETHTYSDSAAGVFEVIRYLFPAISLSCFFLLLIQALRNKRDTERPLPVLIFMVCLLLSYMFMIIITDTYFDRYHIPMITLGILLFAWMAWDLHVSFWSAIFPLVLFFYVSVAGTKDYLEMNRTRWKAYDFLKNKLGIEYKFINGGFEVNCWNEGQPTYPYTFAEQPNLYKYLIQYDSMKGYTPIKKMEFQRYFPYKKDKIIIYWNEKKEKTN